MAMTVPLVMGTISTVSALEKQQQVKLEAYSPQKKTTEYLKENAAQYGLKTIFQTCNIFLQQKHQ